MKMRSSLICCARRATGRFTSRPRCSIGAVTMKMTSSTSITSTSGTTLISASDVTTRGASGRAAPPPPWSSDWSFGMARRLR